MNFEAVRRFFGPPEQVEGVVREHALGGEDSVTLEEVGLLDIARKVVAERGVDVDKLEPTTPEEQRAQGMARFTKPKDVDAKETEKAAQFRHRCERRGQASDVGACEEPF